MFQGKRVLFANYAIGVGVTLSVLMAGCQLQSADEADTVDQPTTVLERLAVPTSLTIAETSSRGGSLASATGIVHHGSALTETFDARLDVLGGEVTLWATPQGYLMIHNLEVDFADVHLSAGIVPPKGVVLTALHARLESPVVTLPASVGDQIKATVTMNLAMEWGIRLEQEVYPMAPMQLSNVPISVELERGPDETVQVRLTGQQTGVFWSWAGRFELSELTVELVSSSPHIN